MSGQQGRYQRGARVADHECHAKRLASMECIERNPGESREACRPLFEAYKECVREAVGVFAFLSVCVLACLMDGAGGAEGEGAAREAGGQEMMTRGFNRA